MATASSHALSLGVGALQRPIRFQGMLFISDFRVVSGMFFAQIIIFLLLLQHISEQTTTLGATSILRSRLFIIVVFGKTLEGGILVKVFSTFGL